MVAIAEACAAHLLPAHVVLVLADVPDAPILDRARERGIPAEYLPPGPFRTKLDDRADQAYVAALQRARVDLVLLAGFMRIVKSSLLRAFPQRVLNIHPALLPAFPGLHAWKQALDYGVKVTGCTVHLVDEGIDTGPILVQHPVPVLENDTPATLHERIQEQERKAYLEAIASILKGNVRIEGRRARLGAAPHSVTG
jgi:phosphoribosylglycinamide formyltransferase-1